MKQKKKILIVSQEMQPYLAVTQAAEIVNKLPQYLFEKGYEIRILMARFSDINDRRHRLHEVVRLSGINISIGDDDMPLIIKVASLPTSRLQVYFLENDDFFRRKGIFNNEQGKFFEDNAERMIFFCKGIFETVKKFGWPPDIIHCHGWFTSLVPMYARTTYKTDPIFSHSKIVTSIYNDKFEGTLNRNLQNKTVSKKLKAKDSEVLKEATHSQIMQTALQYSDGIITVSPEIVQNDPVLQEKLNNLNPKQLHTYHNFDNPQVFDEYINLYQKL